MVPAKFVVLALDGMALHSRYRDIINDHYVSVKKQIMHEKAELAKTLQERQKKGAAKAEQNVQSLEAGAQLSLAWSLSLTLCALLPAPVSLLFVASSLPCPAFTVHPNRSGTWTTPANLAHSQFKGCATVRSKADRVSQGSVGETERLVPARKPLGRVRDHHYVASESCFRLLLVCASLLLSTPVHRFATVNYMGFYKFLKKFQKQTKLYVLASYIVTVRPFAFFFREFTTTCAPHGLLRCFFHLTMRLTWHGPGRKLFFRDQSSPRR